MFDNRTTPKKYKNLFSKSYSFSQYNLAEAKLAIQAMLFKNNNFKALKNLHEGKQEASSSPTENKFKYSVEKICHLNDCPPEPVEFLLIILEEIRSLSKQLREMQITCGIEKIPTLQGQFSVYQNYLAKGCIVTCERIRLLKELIGKRKKEASTTRDEQLFLNDLKSCCEATIKGMELLIPEFKEFDTVSYNVHKEAKQLGGISILGNQGTDLLQGLAENPIYGKYTLPKGLCSGHTLYYCDQITKYGHYSHSILADSKAFRRQKYFFKIQDEKVPSNNFFNDHQNTVSYPIDKHLRENLNSLVDKIDKHYSYFLTINNKVEGHAVTIKKFLQNNLIEFFDPNLGIFLFQDEKNFLDWFTLLIIRYQIYRGSTEITSYRYAKQPEECKPSIPMENFSHASIHPTTVEIFKHDVLIFFNKFYDSDKSTSLTKFNLKNIKEMFVIQASVYISHIEDINVIDEIKSLFNAENFIFKKRFPSIFVNKSFWESTRTGRELNALFENRRNTIKNLKIPKSQPSI